MPEELPIPVSANETQSTNLPAIIPSAALVLYRTQTTLGLLRDVVQESSGNYWYQRGKKASEAQNWEQAKYAFEQCIILDSTHWRGALQLAATLVRKQSKSVVATAILLSYHNGYLSWMKFVKELSESQWTELHILFIERMEAEQDTFEILLAFALVLRTRNENIQARQILENSQRKFEEQVNKSDLWHLLSGALWFQQKNFSNTVEAYDHAIKLNPFNSYTYFNRGMVRFHFNKYLDALSDYNKAISLSSEVTAFYFHRSLVKKKLQDYSGALVDSNTLISLTHFSAVGLYNRAIIKAILEDYLGSIEDFNSVIEWDVEWDTLSNIKCADVYFARGVIKDVLEDTIGALSDYSSAIKLDYKMRKSYDKRALAKDKLGNMAGATADRQAAKNC
ncbi:tetratricopeptide repeat protein [uncultured Hymenobacter sp.]|uniref:tetratricopeptide repeat protein n=1 Tax=uncultured Hymenobacter sp. TaxID=170016 RepID=UPI0035CC5CE3